MTARPHLAALPKVVLHALVALVVAFAVLAGPATAQPAVLIGEIRVDASPLRAKGVGNYADLLEASLQRALEDRFAGRLGAGGSRLTVVLDRFELRGYGSGETDDGPLGFGIPGAGSLAADELAGTATLSDGGRVLAREPLRVALPPGQSGPWQSADFERRRAVALAESFAGWLARRL
ncbi:hypothetical protein [Salinarimonas rosea]|uniref:hypothetical protein n=1 Tax=Salinarimonas rosea TaxID=552063 RepID=UPI000426D2D4|nr:hypothetical protein [Salinarimonas rosea]